MIEDSWYAGNKFHRLSAIYLNVHLKPKIEKYFAPSLLLIAHLSSKVNVSFSRDLSPKQE